jgi:hypothetical protein
MCWTWLELWVVAKSSSVGWNFSDPTSAVLFSKAEIIFGLEFFESSHHDMGQKDNILKLPAKLVAELGGQGM